MYIHLCIHAQGCYSTTINDVEVSFVQVTMFYA